MICTCSTFFDLKRIRLITKGVALHSNIMPYVYFIHEDVKEPKVFKIGKTAVHPAARCEQLQTGNPRKLVIYRWIELPALRTYSKVEESLHIEHSGTHIRGEWFYISREAVDISCAQVLSMYPGSKVSADYPKWTDDDLVAVQEERFASGQYRGKGKPTVQKKYQPTVPQVFTGFSDD